MTNDLDCPFTWVKCAYCGTEISSLMAQCSHKKLCPNCKGVEGTLMCPLCHGRGRIVERICPRCKDKEST